MSPVFCVFCWSDDCTDPGCQNRATVEAARRDGENSGATPIRVVRDER